MLIEEYYYPTLKASLVQYARGDRHFIAPVDPDPEAPKCLGVLFLSGSWKLSASGRSSGPEDLGWHVPATDGTWPREFWNDYGSDDFCQAGPNGVAWLCVETIPGLRVPVVSYQRVVNSFVLQPAVDFIVGSGNFTIGDQSSEPINYWQHETPDPVDVNGSGEVLLVA